MATVHTPTPSTRVGDQTTAQAAVHAQEEEDERNRARIARAARLNAQRADPAARRAGFAPNLPQQEQGQEQEQQTAPDSGILVPESPKSTGDDVQSVRLSG